MSSHIKIIPPILKPKYVYQSYDNFKSYSFYIILGTHRKLPLTKCCLPNNTRALDVKKEQSPQVD